jgi:hypothetical protein
MTQQTGHFTTWFGEADNKRKEEPCVCSSSSLCSRR